MCNSERKPIGVTKRRDGEARLHTQKLEQEATESSCVRLRWFSSRVLACVCLPTTASLCNTHVAVQQGARGRSEIICQILALTKRHLLAQNEWRYSLGAVSHGLLSQTSPRCAVKGV